MKRWTLLPFLLSPALGMAQMAVPEDLASIVPAVPSGAEKPAMSPFQAGVLALKSDNPQEAIGYLTRELAEHPQNEKAWYYRSVCHASLGEATAALNDIDRALELVPGDANARLRRAEINMIGKAYEVAIADLNEVLRAHQTGPIAEHALMGLGEVHMQQGDHTAAIATYDRFVAIAPNDARGWFNRGIAYAHNNEHQLAYDDLSKAIQLDGWMSRAFASRAIELIHLDRRSEACPDLAKAKELGDDSVDELQAIYCQ